MRKNSPSFDTVNSKPIPLCAVCRDCVNLPLYKISPEKYQEASRQCQHWRIWMDKLIEEVRQSNTSVRPSVREDRPDKGRESP